MDNYKMSKMGNRDEVLSSKTLKNYFIRRMGVLFEKS